MKIEYLVKMANEIGAFFASEPDPEQAVNAVAGHLRRFWDPRMPRMDPPATAADASCIPANGGQSPASPMPSSGNPNGSYENRLTVSRYRREWHHSSSASGAGSGARPGSAPTSRSRSIPGPNRRGVRG